MSVKDGKILVLDGRICTEKDKKYSLEYGFRV
jgi:hypothetical protein